MSASLNPATALFIGEAERAKLAALRSLAVARPVDMKVLSSSIRTPAGKAAHRARMTEQSCQLPLAWFVTYSVEHQPGGVARHLSVSLDAGTRVPHPAAVWMIAEEMGFTGSLRECVVWKEELQQGLTVNVMQLVAMADAGNA